MKQLHQPLTLRFAVFAGRDDLVHRQAQGDFLGVIHVPLVLVQEFLELDHLGVARGDRVAEGLQRIAYSTEHLRQMRAFIGFSKVETSFVLRLICRFGHHRFILQSVNLQCGLGTTPSIAPGPKLMSLAE